MKKALKIAVNVILWVFVAFSAMTMVLSLSSAASDGVPSIFGKSLISIQSDSMKPTFKEGDLLFVKPLKGVDRMTLKKSRHRWRLTLIKSMKRWLRRWGESNFSRYFYKMYRDEQNSDLLIRPHNK